MVPGTLLVEIVLAVVIAAGLASALTAAWLRRRPAGPGPASAMEEAARPLTEAVTRLEAQIREFELERQHSLGGLEHQLSYLGKETVALSRALRAPNTRGRWGELTLRRVAELAGMAAQCDFYEQESSNGMRPDMLVKLPGNRTLPVDAKAPLSGYLDAEAALDEAARAVALDRHAQQLSRHVQTLAGREYWAGFDTAPEMVVLFLPGDHFLSSALERDPELLERALAKRVLIATPVTLISVLKGVAYGWRQERLAKNAEELRRIGTEFYDRMRLFAESYVESGRMLGKAVEAYNRSAGSWETRLEPSLRRMRELGVGGTGEVPSPKTIEMTPRELRRNG